MVERSLSRLRKAGQRYPILASPRSRGTALAIQDALRAQGGASLAVAWLVRAAGPGPRGETLRVAAGRAVRISICCGWPVDERSQRQRVRPEQFREHQLGAGGLVEGWGNWR